MNPVISLAGVSLWRSMQEEMHYDLKRALFAVIENRYRKPKRRQVLADVDLTIDAGRKIGIIGANGSGKSTLLKVICGILQPTKGAVTVRGRIAPLIELGAGFDPELSVSDNIEYYGVLLGVRRPDVRKRVGAILDFAELEPYRRSPVKALSSGMAARLGFAIATDVRPEILILDEVLSVGDESFRRKCEDRVREFWNAESTVLVVSHDLGFVASNCDHVIRLGGGRIVDSGAPASVVARYLDEVAHEDELDLAIVDFDRWTHVATRSVLQAPLGVAGAIDEAQIDADSGMLALRGWSGGTSPGGDLYAVLGDHFITRLPSGLPRPDVAAVHGPSFASSGFSAKLPVPHLAKGVAYGLRLLQADGVRNVRRSELLRNVAID